MERIKEALERARQQQALHPPQPNSESQVADTSRRQKEAPITYSRTKVVELSRTALKRKRIIVGSDNDEITSAYKILRTQVLQRMVANGWNGLAITSPGGGQGKTTTAVNLAVSIAREVHHTVLLVDFDMLKPGIHDRLAFTPAKGITDFLMHDIPLNEILINPGIERLVVLPGRESVPNSSELLASPRMAQLVDELKSRYPSRFVLFDLPPLLAVDDALAFSPYVDAVLLVIEEGKTTKDELTHAIDLLSKTQIIGTVLNKSQDKVSRYY